MGTDWVAGRIKASKHLFVVPGPAIESGRRSERKMGRSRSGILGLVTMKTSAAGPIVYRVEIN
jgi:hypothetical protein